ASGHFGIWYADLRRVRDVEIKINKGAKPGKGGRLTGAKVTTTVSKARNIPVGTDALSPDPKHDIYSIEDMPAEVWLWLLYHNHCGIKITGSNYTRYVAAGMWSNFVVDYLLVDAGIGKAVAFGCNQCGNCHLDCPRGGITTKPELTMQNDRALMRRRFRNWAVLNLVKLAVLIDALNRESGALDEQGREAAPDRLIRDIRELRGRTDLLVMPRHPEPVSTDGLPRAGAGRAEPIPARAAGAAP